MKAVFLLPAASMFFHALLLTSLPLFGADDSVAPPGEKREATSIGLSAHDLSIATGQPSLVLMSSGSVHIPVWSLSGGTVGQSVAGLVTGLPKDCAAVKVEIVVTTTDATTSPDFEDVYRVHLSQMVEDASRSLRPLTIWAIPCAPRFPPHLFILGPSSWSRITKCSRTRLLWVRIQREPGDPADTFTKPTGLAMVKVTPQELSRSRMSCRT
jgi:hypothetical protein